MSPTDIEPAQTDPQVLRKSRAKILNQAKPEWVMLGLQWPGPGVLLMASQTLTSAELDFRAKEYKFDSWEQFMAGFHPELNLSVHMHTDYLLVAGPDYATCLQALLAEWSPDDERPALRSSS